MTELFVSAAHKMLVVPKADAVSNMFPGCRLVTMKGNDFHLVPHQPAEAFLLRNMGYTVPAPILTHYEWPGDRKPFDAQRQTAGLLTMNKRAYVLNSMGCVDSETEYLTPTGWQKINQYTGGKVGQYVPATRSVEFVDPTEYVKLPCPEMIRVKTKYGLDQLLSPEHRVLLTSKSNSTKTEVVQAADLMSRQEQWVGGANKKSQSSIGYSQAAIPVTYKVEDGVGIPLTIAQLRVQIMVCADGHFPHTSGTNCVIRVSKQRKIDRVKVLLDNAGIGFNRRKEASGFHVFSFDAPMRQKEFGSWAWAATNKQLWVFTDEVLQWDGHVSAGRREFSSTSKPSADFVQYVFNTMGYTARIVEDVRPGKTTCFNVIIRPNGNDVMLAGVTSTGNKLRSMSIEPSTDGFKYCFMVPSTFLILRRNGCVFASGNTGKTKSALWAWDYLHSIGLAKKMLVVSPLSTLKFTWAREVFNTLPHRKAAVVYAHSRAKRIERLNDPDADILIINHDGAKLLHNEIMELVKAGVIDTICIDELAVYRNGKSERTKTMKVLASAMNWAWGMTGSPMPRSPTDVWAQCQIITPHTVPKFYAHFRDKVMVRINQFKYAPKQDAVETAYSVMQPAVRFTMDDVQELPELVTQTRDIAMGAKQGKVYKALASACHAAIGNSEITAANAGAVMLKLLQVATGWVYDKDRNTVALDGDNRLEALMETIDEAEQKVLVFVPFIHALDGIAAKLTAEGIDHAVVSGNTPEGQRSHIFNAFQNTGQYKVLLAHPQCLAHGITLTTANTIVWYAPVTSLEIYEQANARIRRIGQKHKQLVLHLQSTPVERKIYKLLENNQQVQDAFLMMFADDTMQNPIT